MLKLTYSSLFSLVRGSPGVQWCYANLLHRQIIRGIIITAVISLLYIKQQDILVLIQLL